MTIPKPGALPAVPASGRPKVPPPGRLAKPFPKKKEASAGEAGAGAKKPPAPPPPGKAGKPGASAASAPRDEPGDDDAEKRVEAKGERPSAAKPPARGAFRDAATGSRPKVARADRGDAGDATGAERSPTKPSASSTGEEPSSEGNDEDQRATLDPPRTDQAPPGDPSPSRRMHRDPSLVLELDAVDRPILRDEPDPIATFARFELLGRLATGGMAEIFLARESLETAASRHTAIKIIRGEYAEDGDFANMFLNEGRLAMRLTHPNICTVYECGRHDGRFFMAMEYVHGQTLREVLVRAAKTKRTMPIPALVKIFAIVAEALDFAHRARDSQGRLLRIVHRDVSPHNVMVRYDGVVKLLDFGVAKAEHSTHATEAGALKGKFSYMSPEQAMAEPIDHRADIFSLGVCIFEAITGRRLFHRKAQYDTLKAILEQQPPPLSSFRDDVPEGLEEILARALAKKPDDRYQRAAELQHDLEHLLTELREVVSTSQIAALMEELFVAEMERGPQLDTADDIRERFAGDGATEDLPETVPPPGSRKAMWLGAAAALVVVLGGGVWAASSGDDAEVAPPAEASSPPAEARVTPPPPPVDPVPTDPAANGDRAEPSGEGDPTADAPPTEGEPNAPPGTEDDATLAASPDDPSSQEGTGEPGGADEGPEEAASGNTTGQRGRGRSRGRSGRRGRGGGGTVIVTDPGF